MLKLLKAQFGNLLPCARCRTVAFFQGSRVEGSVDERFVHSSVSACLAKKAILSWSEVVSVAAHISP
jgi:hypothetical protein